MIAKTAVGKVRVKYFAQGKEVHPVQVNGKMVWMSDDGTVRVKTWDTRKVGA